MKNLSWPVKVFFAVLFLGLIFLVLNKHSRTGVNNYHSVIWADAAGYHVYLPATFLYAWEADKFPEDIDDLTGNGFFLDSGKVRTKYNYGVALLQAPFFLLAHAYSKALVIGGEGYELQYHYAVMIAGISALLFGLIFLFLYLKNFIAGDWKILISLVLMVACTNVYYFAVAAPGFSHIYSFFVFSAFLYFTGQYYRSYRTRDLILLSLFFGLAVLIRATNLVIILFFVFYQNDIRAGVRNILTKPRVILFFAGSLILFFIPQIVYWNYVSGELVADMYVEEGFTNALSPEIVKLLFSPVNGWLLYHPVALLMLVVCLLNIRKAVFRAVPVLLMIGISIYLFASWHAWHFGCSYGSRPFVEYYAFLSIPFTIWMSQLRKPATYVVLTLLLVLAIFNLNSIYHYDGCWYGGIWDWEEFLRITFR